MTKQFRRLGQLQYLPADIRLLIDEGKTSKELLREGLTDLVLGCNVESWMNAMRQALMDSVEVRS